MPNNEVIQVRVDARTKNKAVKFFKKFGLSTSDGVRLLITQAMAEKVLPRIPNLETQKAIEECRDGQGEVVPLSELKNRILGKI